MGLPIIRGFPNGATQVQDEGNRGGMKQILYLWDRSKNPSGNSDKAAKLGVGDVVHGMAVKSFDAKQLTNLPSDGISGGKPTKISSYMQFEPDNFVPRFHEAMGQGLDNVWALRCQVDHEKKSDKRDHRSMIAVDN